MAYDVKVVTPDYFFLRVCVWKRTQRSCSNACAFVVRLPLRAARKTHHFSRTRSLVPDVASVQSYLYITQISCHFMASSHAQTRRDSHSTLKAQLVSEDVAALGSFMSEIRKCWLG